MREGLVCPKCGGAAIDVLYTDPLQFRCTQCKLALRDANCEGIEVLDADRARRRRPRMYGDPVCFCCTHAPHEGPCEFCAPPKPYRLVPA